MMSLWVAVAVSVLLAVQYVRVESWLSGVPALTFRSNWDKPKDAVRRFRYCILIEDVGSGRSLIQANF